MNWTKARCKSSRRCACLSTSSPWSKKLSPQSLPIMRSCSMPNFAAYILAKTVNVNAQFVNQRKSRRYPSPERRKHRPRASSVYVAMTMFAFSITLQKVLVRFFAIQHEFKKHLSSLFTVITGLIRSPNALSQHSFRLHAKLQLP